MTDTTIEDEGRPYWLPDWLYQILKWVGLGFLPALSVLVNQVGNAWGLPNVSAVVTTINALGVFVAACICASQVKAKISK